MMPILGIGKTKVNYESGYTLIEILAVLIILGLVGILAFPRYFGTEEKTYLNQIGKLVRADLSAAREEAFCGQREIAVAFSENGYFFKIGDTEIRRIFDKFQFHWEVSVEEDGPAESVDTMTEINGLSENESELDFGITQLCFNRDRDIPETTIKCTTGHFQGKIMLKSDGSASWDYGSK
ncbi:MAG: prepilin-type N-terminal cleavage/methylation domain-containing protein [Firmicutes bacterium]|nr:prepilin-type N-terminal cleavage/methylation domain-containing protein [Bacillota bacterium]